MTLTTRSGKGTELTYSEVDANWTHLGLSENHSFTQSGTGASTVTVQEELRARAVNVVTQFGLSASGTASANRSALAAAVAAHADKALYIPAGTYSIDPSGGTITTSNLIFGDGRNKTILSIAGNGDLFQRSSYSSLQDLTINMNGATYSGDACKFANSSAYQVDRSVEIKNLASGKYALNFAGGGGSQFNSFGCNYHTLATIGADAAVKVTGVDTSATPRSFFGTNGDGCTIWDVGACNDFFIYGGFTNCILFSSSSAGRCMILGLRIGDTTAVTIKGSSHKIIGCVFASSGVTLDTGSTEIEFDSEVTSYNITDSGTNNNVYQAKVTYTPTVTGSVSNLTIGNGTLTGRYSREGKKIKFFFDLTIGATTTLWSGTLFFSLPRADINSSPVEIAGTAWVQTGAGTATYCMVRVEPGLQKVSLFYVNAGNAANVTHAAPYAIAATDNIRVQGEYFTT